MTIEQKKEKSNYEQMKHQMQAKFISYNIPQIIKEWELEQIEDYICFSFIGRQYYIDSVTGEVFFIINDSRYDADYNISMTVFDILTRKVQYASGAYSSLNSFSKIHSSTVPAGSIFDKKAKQFDHLDKRLAAACESLNGIPFGKGDVSYVIPVFRDLHVVFQFWNSDDEFGAELNLLCDRHILNFMHFETMMFLLSHLLDRVSEQLD